MSQLEQVWTGDILFPGSFSLAPGTFVQHHQDARSFGMVVARIEQQLLVLWSVSPRVNPLAFNEDWYVPKKADGTLDWPNAVEVTR
jgi:hypothetical protein